MIDAGIDSYLRKGDERSGGAVSCTYPHGEGSALHVMLVQRAVARDLVFRSVLSKKKKKVFFSPFSFFIPAMGHSLVAVVSRLTPRTLSFLEITRALAPRRREARESLRPLDPPPRRKVRQSADTCRFRRRRLSGKIQSAAPSAGSTHSLNSINSLKQLLAHSHRR